MTIDLEGIADALVNGADVQLPGRGMAKMLDDMESALIKRALLDAGGVKAKAAAMLGIKRTTLVEKLRRRSVRDAR